jgi:hypothetical protein
MSIQDSQWVFSDAQVMPNAGSIACTNCIDLTSHKWKDWINSPIPLWIIVTCSVVPSGGTSIQVVFYQHSADTLVGGTALLTGRDIAIADLSADPEDEGHLIFCAPLLSCLCTVQAGDRAQYCGPALVGSGDVSSGYVDAWLHLGVNPPVWVAPPALADASNITIPA